MTIKEEYLDLVRTNIYPVPDPRVGQIVCEALGTEGEGERGKGRNRTASKSSSLCIDGPAGRSGFKVRRPTLASAMLTIYQPELVVAGIEQK